MKPEPTGDEWLLYLDALLTGHEYWTMRPDGTRCRVDPATIATNPHTGVTRPTTPKDTQP